MRYFSTVVIVCLLTILSYCACIEASALPENKVVSSKDLSIGVISSREFFDNAFNEYCLAKMSKNDLERNNYYAKAINSISKAIALDEENADYYMLGSQIYRGKGGIAYAKGYFNLAESIIAKELVSKPNDIGTNLDYAIVCYAGDVKFWDNYDDYMKVAQKHATKVITISNDLLEKKGSSSNLLRAMALANLILDNNIEAKRLFIEAKNMDSESDIILFFRRLIPSNAKAPTSVNIMYCELYEKTVDKSVWLWPVGEKYVVKEFLLNYLSDVTRNDYM